MIFALAIMCVGVRAQHTVYCEIMQFGVGVGKATISVDFGNDGADELLDEKMDGLHTKRSEPKQKKQLGDDGYFK